MENIRRLIKNLSRDLRQKISSPDFWGLVRKLENNNMENPRLGYAKSPASENVRFGQTPHLHLPAGGIAEILEGRDSGVEAIIFTYFFGLLGINGPMPLEFTNYVYRRSYSFYDHTWRRFLDIIHHRMHVFYYRAFAQNEQSVSFDRPNDDPLRSIVKSLTGLPPEINYGAAIEKSALSYAWAFSFTARNRSGLEEMLRRLLRTRVEVKDFVTAAYDISPDDYAVLGNPKTAVLGVSLQIGRTYLSAAHKFEIRIGPASFDMFPGYKRRSWRATLRAFLLIRELVKLYLDRPLDYSIVVKLVKGSMPAAMLGSEKQEGFQLGYNCWIGSTDRELELRIDTSRFNRMKWMK
ncbi:MAG: type VI secretion system baseplate subunit TssG [Spirochaetaceae bacterium]|jgi:type VI secretion system protein ImpH|nr:type VI secretion system baseplate subunit TssG [Spirochaetaceae bacterium]